MALDLINQVLDLKSLCLWVKLIRSNGMRFSSAITSGEVSLGTRHMFCSCFIFYHLFSVFEIDLLKVVSLSCSKVRKEF